MSSNRSSATNSSPVNGYYEISAENNNNNYILDTEDSNYRKGEKAKKSDSSLIMKSDNQIIRSDEVSDLSRAPFSNVCDELNLRKFYHFVLLSLVLGNLECIAICCEL